MLDPPPNFVVAFERPTDFDPACMEPGCVAVMELPAWIAGRVSTYKHRNGDTITIKVSDPRGGVGMALYDNHLRLDIEKDDVILLVRHAGAIQIDEGDCPVTLMPYLVLRDNARSRHKRTGLTTPGFDVRHASALMGHLMEAWHRADWDNARVPTPPGSTRTARLPLDD